MSNNVWELLISILFNKETASSLCSIKKSRKVYKQGYDYFNEPTLVYKCDK